MTRKIISMKDTFGYNLPQLPQRFFEEDKEINGISFPKGHLDIEWENEKLGILLININDRNYYSVPTEMTEEILEAAISINGYNSPEDYDIVTETELGIEFITELFTRLPYHLDKYKEDNNHLTYLGDLPPAPEFLQVEEESVAEEPPTESSTETPSL